MRTFYSKEQAIATPGTIEFGGGTSPLIMALINGEPGAKEVWTIPVPATPADDTIYSFSIDNIVTVSFQTGTGTTQAQLLDGLFNAYRSNGIANAQGDASKNGSTDLIFTAKSYGETKTLTSANNLVPAITTNAGIPESIPYGVGLTRVSGKQVKRPDATGQKIVAISLADATRERLGVGHLAVTEHPTGASFSGVNRTNGTNGVWCRVRESNIQIDDPIYCSYASGTRGYFSNSATDADDQSAIASFRSKAHVVNDGIIIAKIAFNQV